VEKTQVVVASRNRHKVEEIRSILGVGYEVLSLDAVGEAPVLVEDADTFRGNALAKARQLAEWIVADPVRVWCWERRGRLWVLADDSGLEVDALGGAPGVHSARFASEGGKGEGNASDEANNAKLLGLLAGVGVEDRLARFRCVVVVIELRSLAMRVEAGELRQFEGVCEGRIGFAARGAKGFGYDPLFMPAGMEVSFAELEEATKNRLSHRFKALEGVRAWLSAG
jgi:XTP/dITP diphosphohydrolase